MVSIAARIRPWRVGDEELLAAIGDRLSPASLYTRFLTGTPTLPRQYLRYVAIAPRTRWDAVVALAGDRVAGWAEFARLEDAGCEAELAVVVVDAWQRRGLGTALVRRLAERSREAGVTRLHAEVLAGNLASKRLIRSLFSDDLTVTREGEVLHYQLPLRAAPPLARHLVASA
jgi:GNAT superfamily N-acetyltransferase